MKSLYEFSKRYLLRSLAVCAGVCALHAHAEYVEAMKPHDTTFDAKEFGLKDDGGQSDQTIQMQAAIDALAAEGGGRLIIGTGTYSFSEVAIRSNIHLFVEEGTVIKPLRSSKTGSGKWAFEVGRDGPVENISIRGLGGRFTFSLKEYETRDRVRCIAMGDVTNFLLSDIDIQDTFTTFSSIILSSPDGSKKTGYVGPMNGTIRNCSTFNASNGYGLVQAHAAKNVLFKDLYALGGVAMRLECGVRPKNPAQQNGIFDVRGENITCEDGYVALLLGPHSTKCGVVTVDGINAIGCEFAVKITGGFISKRKKHEGDTIGSYAKGTKISNIHAVYKENAQLSGKHLRYMPKHLRDRLQPDEHNRILRGPAITAVCDHSNYDVIIENVTYDGFDQIKPIVTVEDADTNKEFLNFANQYRQANWAARQGDAH